MFEENAELIRFHGAVEILKEYIQREIELNGNGKFPPSKAASHSSFLQQMQNELFFISQHVDPSTEASVRTDSFADSFARELNMTLDDVQIPKSLFDDDIQIEFETSALSCCSPYPFMPGCSGEYRHRESISSIYYSAPQSLNGDYASEELQAMDNSVYLFEQQSVEDSVSELLVEPSPSKFLNRLEDDAKIAIEESQNANEVEKVQIPTTSVPQNNNVDSKEEDVKDATTSETASSEDPAIIEDNDDSITSDAPLPKYREIKKLLEITNEYGRISDVSTSSTLPGHHPKDNEIQEELKTADDDYVETPPASPETVNNSIDAITEALEAIKINRSTVLGLAEADEIISGYNEMLISDKNGEEVYLKNFNIALSSMSREPLKDLQMGNNSQNAY